MANRSVTLTHGKGALRQKAREQAKPIRTSGPPRPGAGQRAKSARQRPLSIFLLLGNLLAPQNLLLNLVGLLLSRAVLIGSLSPFGYAFYGAVFALSPARGVAVALWSLAGIASMQAWPRLIELAVLAMLLPAGVAAVGAKVQGGTDESVRRMSVPSLLFIFSFLVKALSAAFVVRTPYGLILAFVESLLVFVLAFIFTYALPALVKDQKKHLLSAEEMICLLIMLAGATLGLAGVSVRGLALKNIVGSFLVMTFGLLGGTGLGAAVGVTIGVIGSFAGSISPAIIGLYGFSGLLAGIFRDFGKAGVGLGYLLGYLMLSLYVEQGADINPLLLESGVAFLMFLLLPRRSLAPLARVISGSNEQVERQAGYDRRLRDLTSTRLRELGQVFGELSRSFTQVSATAERAEERSLAKLFGGIACRVCETCVIYKSCWESDFYRTYKNMFDLLTLAEMKGTLALEDIPEEQRRRCIHLGEVVTTINYLLEIYKMNRTWEKKIAESREIVFSQLEGISRIMDDLAREVKTDVEFSEEVEHLVLDHLDGLGVDTEDVMALRQADGHTEVVITQKPCSSQDQCVRAVMPGVSKLLGIPLAVQNPRCHWRTGKPSCTYKLFPSRSFEFTTGVAKRAKDQAVVTGDSHLIKELKHGKLVLLLSDGMGAGPRAALESKATVALLEDLVEAGFDTDLAVRTVNAVLVLRSPDEIFATVDLALIDLRSGDVEFIKVGAAPSYIRHDDDVSMVRCASLPLGILNNIEVEHHHCVLGPGQTLVMVTDGMLEASRTPGSREEWVAKALRRSTTADPQRLAEELLEKACDMRKGQVPDDITVLVAQLRPRGG
ncbi:MAG: stage II sporulation protein E [Bacillota bacterium]